MFLYFVSSLEWSCIALIIQWPKVLGCKLCSRQHLDRPESVITFVAAARGNPFLQV